MTQGKEKSYAGTSNETPQGRAFLKKQLDGLMAEKAQYKEKKLALQQLQQELPNLQEDAEYNEPAGEELRAVIFMCRLVYACSSCQQTLPRPSLSYAAALPKRLASSSIMGPRTGVGVAGSRSWSFAASVSRAGWDVFEAYACSFYPAAPPVFEILQHTSSAILLVWVLLLSTLVYVCVPREGPRG